MSGDDPRGKDDAANAAGAHDQRLPPVDFQTFVISIGSSALVCLGAVDNPETGRREKDLALAKHNIELLDMIQEKTKGNLTAAEERLLGSLLYDLRLKFVEARKS